MNTTIPLSHIASALASMTGTSESIADSFLRELFAAISARLASGNPVKVKHIGTFAPTPDGLVTFTPDKDIESALNRPFEFFEPVPLGDDVTEDMLAVPIGQPDAPPHPDEEKEKKDEEKAEERKDSQPQDEPIPDSDQTPETSPAEDVKVEEAKEEDTAISAIEAMKATPAIKAIEAVESVPSPNITPTAPPTARHSRHVRRRFIYGLLLGILIGAITGTVATWLILNNRQKTTVIIERVRTAENVAPTATDTAKAASSAPMETAVPKPEPTANATTRQQLTDTIRHDRFLTSMARKYYGEMIFWVYIYEENRDRLSHPDRINPGTVVKIPDASKYDIDRNDPESTARARAKAIEIYNRFN